MPTLADIIYPAFMEPYAVQLFMPVTGITAFVAELVTYRMFYRRVGFGLLFLVVLGANIASSLAGIGLASLLPSGLTRGQGPHAIMTQGPGWLALAYLAWPTALVASIAIEYPVLAVSMRRLKLRRLFGAVCLANIASYVVLYVATRIEFWLMWRRP